MKNKIGILILVMVLILAFLLTGCSVNPGSGSGSVVVADNLHTKNTITVNATGNIKVMPDVAYVTVGVKTQDADMKKAQEANKQLMNDLFDALKKAGLTEDDMRTTNYSAYPMYDYTEGKDAITGYEVTNMVQLTIKDIDKVGEYIDIAADSGANTAYPINFALLDETQYYNDALADALAKAKGKADAIATSGEYKILGTLQVTEGGMGYVPYRNEYLAMDDAADMGGSTTPITAGELEVTANITVVYEIE